MITNQEHRQAMGEFIVIKGVRLDDIYTILVNVSSSDVFCGQKVTIK